MLDSLGLVPGMEGWCCKRPTPRVTQPRPSGFDSDSPSSLPQVAGGFMSQLCGLLHAVLPSGTEETQGQASLAQLKVKDLSLSLMVVGSSLFFFIPLSCCYSFNSPYISSSCIFVHFHDPIEESHLCTSPPSGNAHGSPGWRVHPPSPELQLQEPVDG